MPTQMRFCQGSHSEWRLVADALTETGLIQGSQPAYVSLPGAAPQARTFGPGKPRTPTSFVPGEKAA